MKQRMRRINADRETLKKKILAWIVLSLFISLILAAGLYYRFFQELENKSWDWRLRAIAAEVPAREEIKVIVVDQSSLDYFAAQDASLTWPWPRSMYVPIIEFLNRAGARAIAFDMIFSEGGCFSHDDDLQFVEAVSHSQLPITFAVVPSQRIDESNKDRVSRVEATLTKPFLPRSAGSNFASALTPIPELIEAATSFGGVRADPDSDGLFRHYLPAVNLNSHQLPALGFALHRLVNKDPVNLTEFLDTDGLLTLRYRGPRHSYKFYSARSIIQSYVALNQNPPEEPSVTLAELANSYVLIGVDAPGLLDLRPTPLDEKFPGIEIHATALDNLLSKDFIKKMPFRWSYLTALLVSLIITAVIIFAERLPVSAVFSIVLYIVVVAGAFYLAGIGYWLPLVWPLVGMTVGGVFALGIQYELVGRQHRFIRHAFRHYVSPSVIDEIVADPAQLSLGGSRRELTIFFSDIEGFTSISEKMDAAKLGSLLNLFLSEMTNVIMQHGGTVDKYVGDAIVAFWNAPLEVSDHAYRGATAALDCQRRIVEITDRIHAEFAVSIQMRIGIHTGVVNVGNFGSHERFNYTIIGDAANLASRLEGANKLFGSRVLISAETQRLLAGKIATRKLASIQVVGREEPIVVYEPYRDLDRAFVEQFEKARIIFEQGELQQALVEFKKLESDPVSRAYCLRIEHELHKGKPQEWTAVWKLKEK